ncbi:nicotinate-nucleotide--dimethylbenzimidazole phosphoribosyltransferase [Chitinimonas sp. BJB300]|uniref:nicotinate-nucleotide--dimethylbenzimidazole phosphoribosyltransferase n=1 Tax=Chitinimonas sp. BJB300 TaxID=1559339 RepID=UPI000C0D1823|nr:nicotinate-nucleotide--dimethylbenzimidazole phosphoribosyltransferase [Chitinimonas sp. BJB300]PHV11522.1 nicotinate-nucleotide--dimethylbenzimidazole phosphoribosyltransferase [Chitinimonas sp. BJB300]TSJ91381.1 nicotinate-nucleotide--dimethylbenzimidazole phosphoribosyltransferase [Chitinimonas sp. BJB300]
MQGMWWQAPAHAVNETAQAAAATRQHNLTKPTGALGDLEGIAIRLAGLQGRECPLLSRPWISIFAADHGLAAAGLSAYPQAVTAQMVANFAHGGAAICVLAKQIQAGFEVIDVGVAGDTSHLPNVIQAKIGLGTANLLEHPAMSMDALHAALEVGQAAVRRAQANKADCFIGGEMGIGNTSSASALGAVLINCEVAELVGPGSGLDPAGVIRKAGLLSSALQLHASRLASPASMLATLGGFEIAALTGAYIAASQAGIPVLVDGFISTVAALAACKMNPSITPWLLFGHQSAEPAHVRLLFELDGQPLLKLGLRLGEGSGAATAFPLLQLACALHSQMATFAQAGVSNRDV